MSKKKKAPDPAAAAPEELAKWEAEEADRIEVSARKIFSSDGSLALAGVQLGRQLRQWPEAPKPNVEIDARARSAA